MTLSPTAAEPHRYAGRCLSAAGKDLLARREYRLAALFGDPNAVAEGMRRYPGLSDLLTIVPDTPQGLLGLATLLAPERPADAAAVLRRSWADYRDVRALRWLAQITLELGDADEALALAEQLREQLPLDFAGFTVGADALQALGMTDEASNMLEEGARRIPGSPQVLQRLIRQAMARRLFSEARRLAELITARAPGEVAAKHITVAAILWGQRRFLEAIQETRRAVEAVPNDPGPKLVLSDYAAEIGRYDEAISALESAAALPDAAPGKYERRLNSLRAARQQQVDAIYEQGLEAGRKHR